MNRPPARSLSTSTLRAGVALAGLLGLAISGCATGGSSSGSGSASAALKTGPGVDAAAKTITLGVITPLSGPAGLIGKPLTLGQQAYFDWVNAHGGIAGWKVKLTIKDDQYNPQLHVQDYDQMISGVAFIGQSLGSPTTQAIEAQAQQQDVLIGTAAQDSAFVTHPINAVIGTPYAVDVANGLYYVTQTLGKASAKIGIVYQNDAYGQDGLKGFLAAKAAYNFTDAGQVTYNATDTSFTSQALAMKNSGAEYVVLTAIPSAAAGIIGSAAAIGYHPQWILQGPAWSEYLMTSTGGQGGTATPVQSVMAGAWVLGYETGWGDTSAPGMAQFLKIHDTYAASQVPDGYYMYGYCMAMMETDLLRKAIASGDLSRANLVAVKQHLGTIDFGGLIPAATYAPAGGPADRQTDMAVVDLSAPGFLKVLAPYMEGSAARTMTFTG